MLRFLCHEDTSLRREGTCPVRPVIDQHFVLIILICCNGQVQHLKSRFEVQRSQITSSLVETFFIAR